MVRMSDRRPQRERADERAPFPAPLAGFVGRRDEVRRVRDLLAASRVLVLTGPGGIGKTRLALHVARAVERAFPGGLVFIEGAREQQPLLDRLLAALEALPRHGERDGILVVIDDADAQECTAATAALLRQHPTAHCLITSRSRLPIDGAVTFPVGPMPVAAEDGGAWEGGSYGDAVALYVDRATAANASVPAEFHDLDAIGELCRYLDGFPLAIEVAAGQSRTLSPAQLVLRYRAAESTPAGAPGPLTEHPRLAVAVSAMEESCTPAERTVWARCTVFAGRFTLEDVEEVCCFTDDERADAYRVVTALVDKSVLECHEGRLAMDYRLLQPLRLAGARALHETGAVSAMRERHRRWMSEMTSDVPPFWGSEAAARQNDRLLQHLPDVRRAAAAEADHGDVGEAMRMLVSLRRHWALDGSQEEALVQLRPLIERSPDRDARTREALAALAYLAALAERPDIRRRADEEARSIAEEPSALLDLASGMEAWLAADIDLAATALGRAIDGFTREDDQDGLQEAAFCLSLIVGARPEDAAVQQTVEQVLQTLSKDGTWWGAAWAAMSRGLSAVEAGEPARARECLRTSIRAMRDRQDRIILHWCLELLAWLASQDGDHELALQLLGATETHGFHNLPSHIARRHAEVGSAATDVLDARTAARLLKQGRVLPLQRTLSLALGEKDAAGTRGSVEGLSTRETEVAVLIASGYSNRAIAEHLVISTRTAEGHVQRILVKQGFTSRAQIAAWASQITIG